MNKFKSETSNQLINRFNRKNKDIPAIVRSRMFFIKPNKRKEEREKLKHKLERMNFNY